MYTFRRNGFEMHPLQLANNAALFVAANNLQYLTNDLMWWKHSLACSMVAWSMFLLLFWKMCACSSPFNFQRNSLCVAKHRKWTKTRRFLCHSPTHLWFSLLFLSRLFGNSTQTTLIHLHTLESYSCIFINISSFRNVGRIYLTWILKGETTSLLQEK